MVEKMSRTGRQAPQHPVSEAAAWTILSYLITGPALYGGLGWLIDKWLGTTFFVVVGLLGGMALSIYVIYRRYVSPPDSSPPGAPATAETIVAGGSDRTDRVAPGHLSRNQASGSQSPDNNRLPGHQPVGPAADSRLTSDTSKASTTGQPAAPTDRPSDP